MAMNNDNEEIGFLDILNIASFLVQIENMQEDEKETKYIHKVIKVIANEIDKLHKENDIIIEQNEEIIRLLKKR